MALCSRAALWRGRVKTAGQIRRVESVYCMINDIANGDGDIGDIEFGAFVGGKGQTAEYGGCALQPASCGIDFDLDRFGERFANARFVRDLGALVLIFVAARIWLPRTLCVSDRSYRGNGQVQLGLETRTSTNV